MKDQKPQGVRGSLVLAVVARLNLPLPNPASIDAFVREGTLTCSHSNLVRVDSYSSKYSMEQNME